MKTLSAPLEPGNAELLALARKGDHAAYGQLVSRHQVLVVSIAYSICGDFARSQDIAQEAFVTAWRQLNTLEDPAKFKGWLCGITRNLGHNFIRQQSRRADAPASSPEIGGELAADMPGPREHAVTREESAIIWRALEQLPATYREPLILFYREHQSVERVAAALDLSEDTVKQRLSRGRGMLRDQVERLVERSLGFTTPGVMFTAAVLGALPVLTPIVAASNVTAATNVSTTAKAPFALAKLLPSFLLHLAVAFGGYFWQSKRKTPPSKKLFVLALIGWATIGAAVAVVWLLSRS
jgi:RNA polymerase sigma factor (sigma-70 family)